MPGLRAGPQPRAHPLVIGLKRGHAGGHDGRAEADDLGAAALLSHELVEFGPGEPDTAAARDLGIRSDLPAMYPQQLRVIQPEPGASGSVPVSEEWILRRRLPARRTSAVLGRYGS